MGRGDLCRRLLYLSIHVIQIVHVTSQCSSTNLQSTESVALTDSIIDFSTPGYRVAYYRNMDCRWIFDAGVDGATIVFDMKEMLLESYRNCKYDSITFYNGNDTSASVVEKTCGRVLNGKMITVTGRYALMRLVTDNAKQYAGATFRIFYDVDQSGAACSGTPSSLTASLNTAYITSPGYPVALDNGVDCSWSISSQAGTVIFLQIFYSDLDNYNGICNDQVLSIFDGTSRSDPALVAYCESREAFPTAQTIFYTSGNNAFITLSTSPESEATRLGFRLNYRQNSTAITTTTTLATTTTVLAQVCSSSPTVLTATTSWSYFQSVNYPEEYSNNMNCYWRIEAPIGYTINMTVVDSLLQDGEDCDTADAVKVYDGATSAYPEMMTFCGETTPVLVSTGRNLYVHMKTDPTVVYRGFSAKYQLMQAEIPTCVVQTIRENFTASAIPQTITSPGYPNQYNNSVTEYWMISNLNETQTLALEVENSQLEGSVDCKYDSVKIYQGPCTSYPLLKKFCGLDNPTFYYNTGSYALVVMTTDDTVTGKGFSLKFYLTDVAEDDKSIFIVAGIIAGSVIGGLVVTGAIAFGIYKYVKHKDGVSPNTSRRSSSSSSSSDESASRLTNPDYELQTNPRRLPPIKELMPGHASYK